MGDMADDCIDMGIVQMLEDDTGEFDWGGNTDVRRRRSRRSSPTNHLYYHEPLFDEDEGHTIIRETEKAILFNTLKGKFWVPKSLIRGYLVHRCFKRKYLPETP